MIICQVVGHVWSTKKDPQMEGIKLMVVREKDGPKKKVYVAGDTVGAGIGEMVLVVTGSTARNVFRRDNIPIDMAIVGIIDNLEADLDAR